MLYVIGIDNKPLMPCENVVARLLLKEKKAKVIRVMPFTIKLTYVTETTYVQPCVHGVDTGSDKIGSSVVSNGTVLYSAEVKVRNDITKKMVRRAVYRRTRRSRKTRYRAKRFLNRGNSIKNGRISPTVTSKLKELTNKDIIRIAMETRTAEPGDEGYILPISFAREIEKFLSGV